MNSFYEKRQATAGFKCPPLAVHRVKVSFKDEPGKPDSFKLCSCAKLLSHDFMIESELNPNLFSHRRG